MLSVCQVSRLLSRQCNLRVQNGHGPSSSGYIFPFLIITIKIDTNQAKHYQPTYYISTTATASTLLYPLLTTIVIPNSLLEFHLSINHQQQPTNQQTDKQTNNCDNVQPTQRLRSPDQLWPFYCQLFQPLLQLICPLCGIQLPLCLQCPRV